jgi:hypothetical protein
LAQQLRHQEPLCHKGWQEPVAARLVAAWLSLWLLPVLV